MPRTLVWFKRDLRIEDHIPLCNAIARGEIIPLYVYEPSLLQSAEFHSAHLHFINECLAELDQALRNIGGRLIRRTGELPEVLHAIRRTHPFEHLESHEETGNRLTYDRDLRVADWCREQGVTWQETPQTGVIRRLRQRNGWAARWFKRMSAEAAPAPVRCVVPSDLDAGQTRHPTDFNLAEPEGKPDAQRGGNRLAHQTLQEFLTVRGVNYRKAMSSPLEGWNACSRISPYLAWGAISMRTTFQITRRRVAELKELKEKEAQGIDRRWFGSLQSFEGRLRWHCHFMQKLEDEPDLEFRNLARSADGLREEKVDAARFEAWKRGETGYPMVDACMRAVLASGWLNFRMRAMLVSFSSYHLWLHWREPAIFLGRHFLDFEPGIHFSQFQMQSGTTGINSIRIYSPIKQGIDQDPEGHFIRQYLPELAGVPTEFLHEPHRMPPLLQKEAGCEIGRHYPAPIVDHKTAYREAREKMFRMRGQSAAREEAGRIQAKHGSRKSGLRQTGQRRTRSRKQPPDQPTLF